MPRPISIYGIKLQGESQYFYIGSTYRSLAHRLNEHLGDLRRGAHCNRGFERVATGRSLEIELLGTATERHRLRTEYAWMRRMRGAGHPLVNIVNNKKQFQAMFGDSRRLKLSPMFSWYRFAVRAVGGQYRFTNLQQISFVFDSLWPRVKKLLSEGYVARKHDLLTEPEFICLQVEAEYFGIPGFAHGPTL